MSVTTERAVVSSGTPDERRDGLPTVAPLAAGTCRVHVQRNGGYRVHWCARDGRTGSSARLDAAQAAARLAVLHELCGYRIVEESHA